MSLAEAPRHTSVIHLTEKVWFTCHRQSFELGSISNSPMLRQRNAPSLGPSKRPLLIPNHKGILLTSGAAESELPALRHVGKEGRKRQCESPFLQNNSFQRVRPLALCQYTKCINFLSQKANR